MKTNDEMFQKLLADLGRLSYIRPEEIPGIQLYMDQVTTFMDEHLKETKRYADDKVLTKTMINNYAKNNLLPPPVKKKYSKEHMLMLIFIYYFKNMLSFHDIETLFEPITSEHFAESTGLSLEDIYRTVFSMEKDHMEKLKEDVTEKYNLSKQTFTDTEDADRELLQLFAFICEMSFDVYIKKQMIENLIDQFREERSGDPSAKGRKR